MLLHQIIFDIKNLKKLLHDKNVQASEAEEKQLEDIREKIVSKALSVANKDNRVSADEKSLIDQVGKYFEISDLQKLYNQHISQFKE